MTIRSGQRLRTLSLFLLQEWIKTIKARGEHMQETQLEEQNKPMMAFNEEEEIEYDSLLTPSQEANL